jgi:trimeric autotransporter adhesin
LKQLFYYSSVVAVSVLLPLASWAQAPQYTISTVAGNAANGSGYSGDNGPANQAQLANPCGIAVDSSGNLYIADQANERIREAAPGGNINTVAGNGTPGFTGDGGAATSAEITLPCGVAVDSMGDIFFTQTDVAGVTTASAVREVSGGNITTLAGGNSTTPLGAGYTGDGGPAVNAQLNNPLDIKLDGAGNIYIADTLNSAIREITTDGNIRTVEGNGHLNRPEGIALDSAGNLYIADTHNYCVRKLASGVLTTIAGSCGSLGFSGDNGPATQALLNYPTGVAVDTAGDIFIVDSHNFRVRMIAPNGSIYTIAGNGGTGAGGDGGAATSAQLNFPFSIALGATGVVYIGDQQNNEIRALTPVLAAPAISGAQSVSACGAFPQSAAPGSWIEIYGSNLAPDSRPWGTSDFNGPIAPTSLDKTSVSIGGQAAVISYISPGQVNAQAPLNVQPGSQPLIVTNATGASGAYFMTINATEPGLCQSMVNGVSYVTAVVNNTTNYILPSNPAQPGQVLQFFGNGFGPVTPAPAQGQAVQQLNSLANNLQIQIGGLTATLDYSGLAPGAIGLYQFNVVVPSGVTPGNQVPVTFTLNGVPGTQTLYVAVQ